MSIRVFSPYDLNVSYEATSFTDVFDVYTAVDIVNKIPKQSSDQSITPRQYIHWLQKMYSENTDYLKDFFQVKVNRCYRLSNPFSENNKKEVDLYLKLFKNHPDKAWLCEFLSFTNQGTSAVFEGERTKITSIRLCCKETEYPGYWIPRTDDINLNDSSNVTEFLEDLLESFTLYLVIGESRTIKKTYTALTGLIYSNRFLNSIFMFATNKLDIIYKDKKK
jgi:hypothetical protein